MTECQLVLFALVFSNAGWFIHSVRLKATNNRLSDALVEWWKIRGSCDKTEPKP